MCNKTGKEKLKIWYESSDKGPYNILNEQKFIDELKNIGIN